MTSFFWLCLVGSSSIIILCMVLAEDTKQEGCKSGSLPNGSSQSGKALHRFLGAPQGRSSQRLREGGLACRASGARAAQEEAHEAGAHQPAGCGG